MKRICLYFLCLALCLPACGRSADNLSEPKSELQGLTWQEQYDLGVRYLSEGNYQEAIIAFTAAIEIDPKQAPAYVGRGDAYIGSGETEENLAAAQADYEAAIELNETNACAYLGLADVYIRKGDYDKALEVLRLGLEKTGQNQEIADKIAEMESGNISDSFGKLRKLSAYDNEGKLIYYHNYTYDAEGKKKTEISYDKNGIETSHIIYSYDKNGNVLHGSDGYALDSGCFFPADYKWNDTGELLEIVFFYQDGREERVEYLWNNDKTIQETLHYDKDGILVQSSKEEYDLDGHPLKITWFDELGEIGQTGIYEYDDENKLLSITWFHPEDQCSGKWIYRYDSQGNEIGMEEYDGDGNLIQYETRQ